MEYFTLTNIVIVLLTLVVIRNLGGSEDSTDSDDEAWAYSPLNKDSSTYEE